MRLVPSGDSPECLIRHEAVSRSETNAAGPSPLRRWESSGDRQPKKCAASPLVNLEDLFRNPLLPQNTVATSVGVTPIAPAPIRFRQPNHRRSCKRSQRLLSPRQPETGLTESHVRKQNRQLEEREAIPYRTRAREGGGKNRNPLRCRFLSTPDAKFFSRPKSLLKQPLTRFTFATVDQKPAAALASAPEALLV